VGGACDGSPLGAGCVTGALLVGVKLTLRPGDRLEIASFPLIVRPEPGASISL
jgi:hypothetical protein